MDHHDVESLKTTKTIEHKCLESNLNIKMIYISYNNPERFHIPSGIALMASCHECVIRSNSQSCSSPSHITFVNRSLIYVPCSHAKYEILEIILRINILAKGKTTVPRQKKGKLSWNCIWLTKNEPITLSGRWTILLEFIPHINHKKTKRSIAMKIKCYSVIFTIFSFTCSFEYTGHRVNKIASSNFCACFHCFHYLPRRNLHTRVIYWLRIDRQ